MVSGEGGTNQVGVRADAAAELVAEISSRAKDGLFDQRQWVPCPTDSWSQLICSMSRPPHFTIWVVCCTAGAVDLCQGLPPLTVAVYQGSVRRECAADVFFVGATLIVTAELELHYLSDHRSKAQQHQSTRNVPAPITDASILVEAYGKQFSFWLSHACALEVKNPRLTHALLHGCAALVVILSKAVHLGSHVGGRTLVEFLVCREFLVDRAFMV
eukprot:357471-Chlamydomonas_euryale.AAC.1